MTAIRVQGKVNDNTYLIDAGLAGVIGTCAVYLIQSQKICLIDGAASDGAMPIMKVCKDLGLFPEIVIITHPHWDHCQAIPKLREHAKGLGIEMKVMASQDAIPLLEDRSWEEFEDVESQSIPDVIPLSNGEEIDLGDVALEIVDTPGHCQGHIAIYDQANKNIFVGDSIGAKFGDNAFMPLFFPPFWDWDAYSSSIEIIKKFDYETISIAHYGVFFGKEAEQILDESLEVYDRWWDFFKKHESELDDIESIKRFLADELKYSQPEHPIRSMKLRILFQIMVGFNKLVGKKTTYPKEMVVDEMLSALINSYRHYAN